MLHLYTVVQLYVEVKTKEKLGRNGGPCRAAFNFWNQRRHERTKPIFVKNKS